MEESIKIKAVLEKKSHVLSNPKFYKGEALLCFIPESSYAKALRDYFTSGKAKPGMAYEVVIRPYPSDPTERARKHFFALRDRLAEHMGDSSKEHKDHLYRICVKEFMFMDINGGVKNSIRELTRNELWKVTELMMDWLAEAEAYVNDLVQNHEKVREEYIDNENTSD